LPLNLRFQGNSSFQCIGAPFSEKYKKEFEKLKYRSQNTGWYICIIGIKLENAENTKFNDKLNNLNEE